MSASIVADVLAGPMMRPTLLALGRAAIHPRPESMVVFASPDAVRFERRELLAAELCRDGLRDLARAIERRRVAVGHVLVVAVADDAPTLATFDLRPPVTPKGTPCAP